MYSLGDYDLILPIHNFIFKCECRTLKYYGLRDAITEITATNTKRPIFFNNVQKVKENFNFLLKINAPKLRIPTNTCVGLYELSEDLNEDLGEHQDEEQLEELDDE